MGRNLQSQGEGLFPENGKDAVSRDCSSRREMSYEQIFCTENYNEKLKITITANSTGGILFSLASPFVLCMWKRLEV